MINLGNGVMAHNDLTDLLVDIDSIKPHPSNPRNGDTEAISESIRMSGMYRPVYVQRSTGRIIAGNHTYAAAMELGADKIPAVMLDLNDTDAVRIMLADNRTADLGTYDDSLIAELLTTLRDEPGGIEGSGYDDRALTRLLASLNDDDGLIDGLTLDEGTYSVIVSCDSEDHQRTLLAKFENEGLTARPMIL